VLLAFLVAALVQAGVPHVILWLLAEQGMTKSSATRIIVDLLDPSAVPLRQPPRDPDGWTTAAAASWVAALDNLSGQLSDWLSDALCRASTGDGQVKRARLFVNMENIDEGRTFLPALVQLGWPAFVNRTGT
jgi:hypothetical protein